MRQTYDFSSREDIFNDFGASVLNSVSLFLLINDISFLYFDNHHFNFQTVQLVFMETVVKSLAR